MIRAKRSAAQAQMMEIANRQQQFLLANRSYADKTALTASGYSLPADVAANYDYTITLSATEHSSRLCPDFRFAQAAQAVRRRPHPR